MSALALERKLVELASKPREFLLLDAADGLLRGSYWRPALRPGEGPTPPQSIVDQLHAEGVLPAGGARARDAWVRMAASRERLEDLLWVLLEPSWHDPRTVELYLRTTEWGAGLP